MLDEVQLLEWSRAVKDESCWLCVLGLTELCVLQAAELVTANLSDYESHMKSTRGYLEERLQVRVHRSVFFCDQFNKHHVNKAELNVL